MKKKIGILGGISLASTIQYYRTITDLYYARACDYFYPEILINSLDFQYFTDLENEHRTDEYIEYISAGLQALQRAGADFAILAANSPHSVFSQVQQRVGLPLISIVQVAAQKAQEMGLKKLLLTGIKYTMQGDFYQQGFQARGMTVLTPTEAHQDEINAMIFEELVLNRITAATRDRFNHIIHQYDVGGVILGCTELPLLLKQSDTDLPLLDTLTLHARAALEYSLDE